MFKLFLDRKHFAMGTLLLLLLNPLVLLADESALNAGDTAWVLICSALVMLMTPGLAFFYAGMTRTHNVVSTLFQNFSALGVVGIIWAICGYSLSFDAQGNGFFGGLQYFFLQGVGAAPNSDYAATIPHSAFMIFQCMFAVITPVLISGAVAERVKFTGFILFCALWSLFVYAPVAHMVWGVGGFIRQMGALDFAGGLVVHMTAGFSALVLSILVGKRKGFPQVLQSRPHDVGMVLLGTSLLWFGWFGFNAGSALAANGLASHAFSTTFLSSAAAFVAWVLFDMFRGKKPSALGAAVGAVAGLVTITPGAGFVTLGSSLIFGCLAGVICNYVVTLVKEKFHLDDTLDVIACHATGGFLGTILTAIYATTSVNSAGANGLFYGSASLLGVHFIASGIVIAISCIGTFGIYHFCQYLVGMRVTAEEETIGLDLSQHGEIISSTVKPLVEVTNTFAEHKKNKSA